ncbi:MAG: PqqD family protein [Desulfobacula sp.]|jgi:hypothetical protein|nr:PqqD family protein [Desulfobacula sp.]
MEKISLKNIYLPSEKVISRIIEDDLIIVPVESDTIDFDHSLYSLKDTGKENWERLNEKITLATLCQDLSQEYNTPMESIQKDVIELMEDLLEKGLVVKF